MGFGTIVANIIMFISILSVATALVIVFHNYTEETTAAMSVRTDSLKNTLETDLTITNVVYNSSTGVTTVHVLNTGSTELTINKTDIFLDGRFIPRDENKTINVVPSTYIRNLRLWDPDEVLEVTINKTIQNETTHILDVVTEYGVRDSEVFSN
ncbi:hypothetical protein COV93_00385 [Candidatus Woesearchaeota archaeon CG11_big_fil_rev_8_21_14_0_20_43_8]|nr:MAG: hypothetical protein COV93_00385 [Candidatus Woesearchaeota archaeon CG11_big_fil_rev_8_21_14_0_20_43_8]PIO04546.1 MAG: hypothetical protein COT47_08510 [Candidatus Woesearchaeota archaeon CG08_land_8_20_14_0_20_43_7]